MSRKVKEKAILEESENPLYNEQVETKQKEGFPWKKCAMTLLFPHPIVICLMFNLTLVGLIYIFVKQLEESISAIMFYAFSFYTLVVVCAKIPQLIKKIQEIKRKVVKDEKDAEKIIKSKLYLKLATNMAFALFKIITGVLYRSQWLLAMAGYNSILSVMSFLILYQEEIAKKSGTEMELRQKDLRSYQACGWLMMLLNIAISVLVGIVVVENHTISYPGIMIFGIATYTVYCFTIAVINVVKYRKLHNPMYSAVKRIDLAKALVSIFTMQVALITQFSEGGEFDAKLMNILTGVAICITINTMAAMMIAGAKRSYEETLAYEQSE